MDNDTLNVLQNQFLNLIANSDKELSTDKFEQTLGPSQLLFIGKFGIYIYRFLEEEIEFYSNSAEQLLGYEKNTVSLKLLQSLVQPNDQVSVAIHEQKMKKFFQALGSEECLKFKVGFDFRIRRSDGSYIRVYHQSIPLSCRKDGRIDRMLVIMTDISGVKSSTTCQMSLSGLNGQAVPDSFPQTSAKVNIPGDNLSRRELEVLDLIAQNCSSENISKILIISPHTVKVHRKNLLKKTQSKNALELVMKAKEYGWV